jgi:hypothetical protein
LTINETPNDHLNKPKANVAECIIHYF